MIFNELSLTEIGVLAALVGYVIKLAIGWIRPNTKQDQRLALLEQCVGIVDKRLDLIENNSLKHIESELKEYGIRLERLTTVLEERLPKKENGLK